MYPLFIPINKYYYLTCYTYCKILVLSLMRLNWKPTERYLGKKDDEDDDTREYLTFKKLKKKQDSSPGNR